MATVIIAGQLSCLQQHTTFIVYMAQFVRLMNEVQRQTEDALISFFIAGLKSEIQEHMVGSTMTLRRALAEVKILEACKGSKRFKGGGYIARNKSEILMTTPPATTSAIPIVCRTLTIEQTKERSAKGLCFNYDDQYVSGYRCKGKLFLLSADKDCD